MSYPFSTLRRFMDVLGSWPLQSGSYLPRVRWILSTIIQFSVAAPTIALLLNVDGNHNTETALENLLVSECSGLSVVKNIILRINMNKVAENLAAANSDWSAVSKDSESFKVMHKYDRFGKFMTLAMCIWGNGCLVPYIASVVLRPKIRLNAAGELVRNFMIYKENYVNLELSDWEHAVIIIVQAIQGATFITAQTTVDAFFFSTVMHLCGQFDILRMQFHELGERGATRGRYKEQLRTLVNRHCKLMDLVKNIEDSFNFMILLDVLVSTVLIGSTGFRLIVAVRTSDAPLMLICTFVILYYLMQNSVYAYASDCLQTANEAMFYESFNMSWQVPPNRRKDFLFIMTMTNVPLRITGGKFFQITCKTVLSIVSKSFSYVSVMQALIRE